jgi:hypothetical protein
MASPPALTDDVAAAYHAARYAIVDPFPSLPPALLGSAEIYDYVSMTRMLCPFYPDSLKSASYEAHIGGSLIWWDEQGKRHDRQIVRGDPCVLLENSITFVQVEPKFRLPNCICSTRLNDRFPV